MKKLIFLSILIILIDFILSPLNIQASTPYMKKLDVKFDLEENTWAIVRTQFPDNIWISYRAMIKNIKIKKSDKTGYKQLTCDIFFGRYNLTKKQTEDILHSKYCQKYNDIGVGEINYWIFDYYTGNKGLELNNVKIKSK